MEILWTILVMFLSSSSFVIHGQNIDTSRINIFLYTRL